MRGGLVKFAAALLVLAACASGCVEVASTSAGLDAPAAQATVQDVREGSAAEVQRLAAGKAGEIAGDPPTPHIIIDGGVDLAPGETVRVLTYEQWRVLQAAFGERTYVMARIAFCEGGLDPTQVVLDVDGTYSYGTFMVKPQFWGPVGDTLAEQAAQAAAIAEAHPSLWPWYHTRHGCRDWNR